MSIPSKARIAREPTPAFGAHLTYDPRRGILDFVSGLHAANAVQLAQAERSGVPVVFLQDLSSHMHLKFPRVIEILGIPRATAAEKLKKNTPITGAGGQAALGMARLLARAQQIVANSTSPQARGFEVAPWLGEWIETPQPALGGRKPADLLDTPSGLDAVMRVLGALESGAYQ